jgi:hypothetical protein
LTVPAESNATNDDVREAAVAARSPASPGKAKLAI